MSMSVMLVALSSAIKPSLLIPHRFMNYGMTQEELLAAVLQAHKVAWSLSPLQKLPLKLV